VACCECGFHPFLGIIDPSINQCVRQAASCKGMSATNVAMVAQCQTRKVDGAIFESFVLVFDAVSALSEKRQQ